MFEELVADGASAALPAVIPLIRPGWTVSEHPSGMLIWRSPTGRHVLHRPGGGSRRARRR